MPSGNGDTARKSYLITACTIWGSLFFGVNWLSPNCGIESRRNESGSTKQEKRWKFGPNEVKFIYGYGGAQLTAYCSSKFRKTRYFQDEIFTRLPRMIWWMFVKYFIDIFFNDVMPFSVSYHCQKESCRRLVRNIVLEAYSPVIRIRCWWPMPWPTSPTGKDKWARRPNQATEAKDKEEENQRLTLPYVHTWRQRIRIPDNSSHSSHSTQNLEPNTIYPDLPISLWSSSRHLYALVYVELRRQRQVKLNRVFCRMHNRRYCVNAGCCFRKVLLEGY